jgi:hypothetical protein
MATNAPGNHPGTAILYLVPDSEDPYRIVAELMAALPPGSYLAISHPASDIHPPRRSTRITISPWISGGSTRCGYGSGIPDASASACAIRGPYISA